MSALADGRYDVIVVDVETSDASTVAIDLALTDGDSRGDVVTIRGSTPVRDPLALLGLPGVLFVEDGRPRFVLDPTS